MPDEGPSGASPNGLQPERTALAWTRTSLALLANGALLLVRYLASSPSGWLLAAAGLAALLAAAAWWAGMSRQRELFRLGQHAGPPSTGLVGTLCWGTATLGAATVVLLLTGG